MSPAPPAVPKDGAERWLVRIGAVLVLLAAALLLLAGTPRTLPAAALGSGALLRVERAGVALLGGLFLLVFVGRLVVEGRLPTKIGRDNAEWPDAALADSTETEADLQLQITALQEVGLRLQERLDRLDRPPSTGGHGVH